MCGRATETLPHVLSWCSFLAQSKYLNRHNAALKILFFERPKDHKLVDSVPSWNSPVTPKPMCTSHLMCKPIGMYRFTLTILVSKLTEWMRGLWIIRERKSGQLKLVVRGWRIPERRMRKRQSSTVLCDGSWESNTQGITSTSVILCYIS